MKSNICLGCLKSGCDKNLSNNYMFVDKLENYGDMLTITFNLTLDLLKKYICEECVKKLRDAAAFKQKILEVDETLKKLSKTEHLKDEPVWSEDCLSDSSNSTFKRENHNKLKSRKRQCIKNDNAKHTTKKVKKKSNPKQETQNDQRENSIKLISHSNICLFKSLRTRFACYVCNEKFFDIKDLRFHSKVHSTDDFKQRFKRLRGKSYENVDISNLRCNICSESCTDLDILRKHLSEQHSIVFGDASHILIPYKLEDGFQCNICKDTFNTFTRLSIHMNSHATSNVCETCGMAFFNRVSLRNHIRSIHREHKCTQCSLKLPTSTKMARHRQRVHGAAAAKHYCLRCHMIFQYQYLLKQHMVEKHNAVHSTVECSICGKVFKEVNCLKTHIRSVHLKERDFSCSSCDLRFFTRNDRVRHERTHQNDSLFACHLCEIKFKSKDSVRRHLKRQHADLTSK